MKSTKGYLVQAKKNPEESGLYWYLAEAQAAIMIFQLIPYLIIIQLIQ